MNALVRDPVLHLLIQAFGSDEGLRMFDAAKARNAHMTLVAELQADLERVRREGSAAVEEAQAQFAEAQASVNTLYAQWLNACNVYEAAKIRLQQSKVSLRNEVAAILEKMKGPRPPHKPLVENWGRPSWYKPEGEHKEQ